MGPLDGPLGGAIYFEGLPGYKPPSGTHPVSDNAEKWEILVKAICHEEEAATRTFSRLSIAQSNSLRVLVEWWQNDNLTHHQMLKEWIRSPTDIVPIIRDQSLYEARLFELWLWEIGTHTTGTEAPRDLLITIAVKRRDAASLAAAYQLARAACSGMQLRHAGAIPPEMNDIRIGNNTKPPLPACLHPCSWLGPQHTQKGYPHFLWDRARRETVQCPQGQIDYLVISHTWGRWALSGQKSAVPGVPWEVPKNTVFEVLHISDMLDRVPFDIRYIWLDLVCIPQDGGDLMASEIARQATIFASAKWATVWFSAVEDFEGLRASIEFFSIEYLRGWERSLPLWSNDCFIDKANFDIPSGMARPVHDHALTQRTTAIRGHEDESKGFEPEGWFTSLWTLQEACLRPDMFICDRYWHILYVSAEDQARPVTLDNLIALFNHAFARPNSTENRASRAEWLGAFPKCAVELSRILHVTAMHKLLEMSAIDILILGSARYCQDANRAKAIMSVLGVTNWYTHNPYHYDETSPELFVTGKYPIEFVQEMQATFGALLFTGVVTTTIDRSHYRFDFRGRIKSTRLGATMLPWKDANLTALTHVSDIAVEDHPCTRDWVIEHDGAVTIQMAGIVASSPSRRNNGKELKPDIYAFPPGESRIYENHDLNAWLSSFRPRSEKHAVCLLRQRSCFCQGIILERVYCSKAPQCFIKIAFFFLTEVDNQEFQFPVAEPVDWRVL